MRPAAKWSLAATLTAMAAAMAVAGYGAVAWIAGAVRGGADQLNPWGNPFVLFVEEPALSLVDLGLIGVILILLGVLATVLLQSRHNVDPKEARLVQELHRSFRQMERRLDRIENLVLKQVGGIFVGPRAN